VTRQPRAVALIPARSGSTRVPDKNVAPLAAHPLIAYSIASAHASGVFDAVVVSTDSPKYAAIAAHYGAEVPALRPAGISGDRSPDIEWVEHMLAVLEKDGRHFDVFAILRPTSPFRQAETIRRAWTTFLEDEGADSLRAVEPCRQHPGKMWVWRGNRLLPLLPLSPADQPWHSSQYQALPEVFVQNASLEIAWVRVVTETRTIAGVDIVPFLTVGHEGFDVNQPYDLRLAEELVRLGQAALPSVPKPAYAESTTR
jgi:CMP-N,N'-diacetyllegionaminic acid synthase